MPVSRSDARRLATDAMNIGANVLRGTLSANGSEVLIGDTPLKDWLIQHAGREVVLIAARVALVSEEPEPITCPTCGYDYIGVKCPHCASARARLRGG
ncbi:MAG: hypothetical protein ACE5H9_04910 [Anaerolineae bacterium]